MMSIIDSGKTFLGRLLKIIGWIAFLGCGLYITIWSLIVIADVSAVWVAVIAFILFPILLIFAVPIAWILTGTFPLTIFILWIIAWVAQAIVHAGSKLAEG